MSNPFLYVALGIISIFIFFEVKGKTLIAFFLKALASFSFIVVFVSNIYSIVNGHFLFFEGSSNNVSILGNDFSFILFLFLGLICGLIGDLVLELRPFWKKEEEHHIILAGVIAFSIGHLFYLAAIIRLNQFHYQAIIFSLFVSVLVFISGKLLKLNWKKSIIPSLLYSFLIFFMIGETIFTAIDFSFDTFSIFLMIGAILFGISDLILSQIYFKNQNKGIYIITNLSCYYLAQLLIASSIVYLFQ
ncbi:MAG: lysoplasmalogenase [Firmicutes bacterium]|nr:lysoplasmalogenase [Bacillota bacterium]